MEKKPRESFVFYRSFYDAINKCPADSRLVLYEAITRYALDGIEPRFEGILDLVWTLVKPQLDANWKRYLNGFKGGAPVGNQNAVKQPKNNQKTTKKQPNVNVNDNDNVNVNDNKNENFDFYFSFLETEKQKKQNKEEFCQNVMKYYNMVIEKCGCQLRPVKVLSETRKQLIVALAPLGNKQIAQGIINAARSNYLNGRTKARTRPADFDWIMRYENFVKCVEGTL